MLDASALDHHRRPCEVSVGCFGCVLSFNDTLVIHKNDLKRSLAPYAWADIACSIRAMSCTDHASALDDHPRSCEVSVVCFGCVLSFLTLSL